LKRISAKNLQVDTRCESPLPLVSVDPDRIQQIFQTF
jgi:hypothetical protein